MKKLLITLLCLSAIAVSHAQTITIKNSSSCNVNYYLAATGAGCAGSATTVNYNIPAMTTVSWTFGTATWTGVPPAAGWQWQFIKEWNNCGPYNWVSPNCSGGANQNVCAVGIPCSGLPPTSCMLMNTTCNTCSAVKTQWTALGGGNVLVNIW